MKSYSLSTLLLLTVIVALILSQLLLMHQLSLARAEVNDVRRKFGYIHVVDETKTHVAQIAENEADGDAYRLWIPRGSRYFLHLTDATFESSDSPTDPIPTKSVSLNDWERGADTVLSCVIYWENNAPRVVVHSKTSELFSYVLPDWNGASSAGELTWFQGEQREYNANQNIQLMLWRNTSSKRGILLWLEPFTNSEKRQGHPSR
jgi:hypothetical protein